MDPVPLHDYVIAQQRSVGDSSNKRKAACLGHMSDSYYEKLSQSEERNQELAAQRGTDNDIINGTLLGENLQGHAAGRMSNHNFLLPQDVQQEPCGLSHESQGKTPLSYPGVKDIHVGSATSFSSYSRGMVSGRKDCVPASTSSLMDAGSIIPPHYFTPMKTSEMISRPGLQPSSVSPLLDKDLYHLSYKNMNSAVNVSQNAQGLGIELDNLDHPNIRDKASSVSFNNNNEGLGATSANKLSDAHAEVSQSSVFANGSSGNFQPHFKKTCRQAAIGRCISSKSTQTIMDAQHVLGLVGNAVSAINCGCLMEIDSNNSNASSEGSELRSLNQQTGQNDSETENMKHASSRKYQGPNSHDSEERKGQKDLPCSSLAGIVNLHDKNAVPSSQEALWNGFLQLNASLTVATVAYFKSGEQNSKINWPEHIEVKGRVRLEAFEKFIQDLPRSRHRALMVVSFCGSVSSSKAGLVGMEEVAKSYEESKRIGFAEVCPGIDLYICPRSETIITILAKYGFYKGMATARGNHLLIGCIVWRRNPNSRQKSFEKRKQSSPEKKLDSTSSLQGADARAPLPSCTVQKSDPKLLISAPPAKHVYAPVKNVSQGPVANSAGGYMVPLAATREESESTCGNGLPEVGISLCSLTSKSTGLSFTGPDSSYLLDIGRQFLTNNNSNFQAMAKKPATESKEVMSAGHKLPGKQSNQQTSNLSDDDDLPEFDFSKTCGLARCTSSMPPTVDSEGQIAGVHSSDSLGARKCDGSATTALLDIIPRPTLVPQGSEFPRLPKPIVTDTHGTSILNMIRKSDCEPPCLPVPQAKSPGGQLNGARSVGTTVATSVPTPLSASYLRKLWDDDDAMPEWRPPYLEVKEPVESRAPPASGPLLPLQEPQSTVANIVPQPPIHKVPSGLANPFRPSAPTNPLLHSRVPCYGRLPTGVTPVKRNTGMHADPGNIGSNYNSKSASAKVFRPSSNSRFESKPPVNRRGWKH
ncbi:uncharacterized protein LOC116252194 isoform X2 [Nymphaea colorata]|uniref:uncharacterized protein LOC116252194 isoform X2 n=1 Tax=Nymphaea colorata TaxID=210225 RepID=UPI00129DF8F3|nr:uncharacterized protein LOC116252194 isoform X2 [Nymphaea colorata]